MTPSTPEGSKPVVLPYTKSIGSPEPTSAAQTSFDVDLHQPGKSDTYATISKEYYNDVKYAAALQEYNGRRSLQGSNHVEVPPIHVLKKRYPQLIGAGATTVGRVGDGWSTAGAATPEFRPTGQRTFTVPAGRAMTMTTVALDVLGSAARWKDIYDLNPSFSPSEYLPAGAVLRIPTEAKTN
jgi:hypothetical protein